MLTKFMLIAVLLLGQNASESKDGEAVDKSGPAVPERVKQMEGEFAGKWTSFAYRDGKTVERVSWTDTLVCDGLLVVGNKASVNFQSESVFPNQSSPRERNWKEGYFLNEDGGVGDRYVEFFGNVRRLKQVSPTTWVYSIPMATAEFKQMGFNRAVAGEHVVIMVERKESGIDTRRLTRITSVVERDASDQEKTVQFISLQGFHKRVR